MYVTKENHLRELAGKKNIENSKTNLSGVYKYIHYPETAVGFDSQAHEMNTFIAEIHYKKVSKDIKNSRSFERRSIFF